MVEHVSLAFHWHRFVCFWILYNICRAHHGMAVPEGKYLYWKTTIWLGYILTQWGRCKGQPFSCWALEPLVVKSGENMNILILLFMGKIWTFSFSSIRCICSPMQNHQVSCRKQYTLLSQAWLWTVESEMTTFISKSFKDNAATTLNISNILVLWKPLGCFQLFSPHRPHRCRHSWSLNKPPPQPAQLRWNNQYILDVLVQRWNFLYFLSDPGPIIVYPSQWLTNSLTESRPCWRLNELT